MIKTCTDPIQRDKGRIKKEVDPMLNLVEKAEQLFLPNVSTYNT
jgi:hypothetical protein